MPTAPDKFALIVTHLKATAASCSKAYSGRALSNVLPLPTSLPALRRWSRRTSSYMGPRTWKRPLSFRWSSNQVSGRQPLAAIMHKVHETREALSPDRAEASSDARHCPFKSQHIKARWESPRMPLHEPTATCGSYPLAKTFKNAVGTREDLLRQGGTDQL